MYTREKTTSMQIIINITNCSKSKLTVSPNLVKLQITHNWDRKTELCHLYIQRINLPPIKFHIFSYASFENSNLEQEKEP